MLLYSIFSWKEEAQCLICDHSFSHKKKSKQFMKGVDHTDVEFVRNISQRKVPSQNIKLLYTKNKNVSAAPCVSLHFQKITISIFTLQLFMKERIIQLPDMWLSRIKIYDYFVHWISTWGQKTFSMLDLHFGFQAKNCPKCSYKSCSWEEKICL